MPPRRTSSRRQAQPPDPPKPARRSSLAKECEVTALQEDQIRTAFSQFSIQHEEIEDSEEGVIPRADVRRAFIAMDDKLSKTELAEALEICDPENEGYVRFTTFFEYAAIRLKTREEDQEEDEEEGGRSGSEEVEDSEDSAPRPAGRKAKVASKTKPKTAKGRKKGVDEEELRAQVAEAYGLFTRGSDRRITIADLRRIAKDLNQELDDQALKDMILEANGGIGADGQSRDAWKNGVGVEEFEDVMRRAKAFA